MSWLRQHYALLRLPSIQLAGVIAALSFVVTTNQWLAFSFFTTMPANWLRWLYGFGVAFLVFIFPAYTRYREQKKQQQFVRLTAEPPKAQSTWGWLVAAAVTIAAPVTAEMEGYVPIARPDPTGIETVCYGERLDLSSLQAGVIYSKAQCLDRLRHRLTAEYAPPVLKCLPQLKDARRTNVFAALIDAAWNTGPRSVCASPMATRIRAGHWASACHGFSDWYRLKNGRVVHGWRVAPQGVPLRGLVNRRVNVEAPLCARGV